MQLKKYTRWDASTYIYSRPRRFLNPFFLFGMQYLPTDNSISDVGYYTCSRRLQLDVHVISPVVGQKTPEICAKMPRYLRVAGLQRNYLYCTISSSERKPSLYRCTAANFCAIFCIRFRLQ